MSGIGNVQENITKMQEPIHVDPIRRDLQPQGGELPQTEMALSMEEKRAVLEGMFPKQTLVQEAGLVGQDMTGYAQTAEIMSRFYETRKAQLRSDFDQLLTMPISQQMFMERALSLHEECIIRLSQIEKQFTTIARHEEQRKAGTLTVGEMRRLNPIRTDVRPVAPTRPAELKKKSRSEKKAEKEAVKEQKAKQYADEKAQATIYKQDVMTGKVTTLDTDIIGEVLQTGYARKEIMTKKQVDYSALAAQGDFSQFEQLNVMSRNILAINYMKNEFAQVTAGAANEPVADIVERMYQRGGVTMMTHPLLRLGMSLYVKAGQGVAGSNFPTPEKLKELEEALNVRVMEQTISHIMTKVEETQYLKDHSPKDLQEAKQRDLRAKQTIFRNLLLTHLGNMQMVTTKQTGKESVDWPYSHATAFSHCSRVAYSLPKQGTDDSKQYVQMNEALIKGYSARWGATHRLQRKGVGKEFMEKKGFSPFDQHGMDIAIGGFGNGGVPGTEGKAQMLKNDGTSGHLYTKLDTGDESTYGGMLVGFESDSFLHTNQMGHTHMFATKNEHASGFGGQRVDEIGDKYGGRIVNLERFSSEQMLLIMRKCDEKIESLVQNNNVADLERITSKVCGVGMKGSVLEAFLKDLAFSDDEVQSIMK